VCLAQSTWVCVFSTTIIPVLRSYRWVIIFCAWVFNMSMFFSMSIIRILSFIGEYYFLFTSIQHEYVFSTSIIRVFEFYRWVLFLCVSIQLEYLCLAQASFEYWVLSVSIYVPYLCYLCYLCSALEYSFLCATIICSTWVFVFGW
jgi:hypothetical protein